MTGLVPLFLMYLYSQRNGMRAPPAMPAWPTAASPPPPMPAFQPQPTPAPTADTGTPLAELQAAQPAPPPMPVEPGRVTPKPKPTPAARAAAAAKKLAARNLAVRLGPARIKPAASTPAKAAAVADLQAILNARGAKLKRDGLYGPATANAWMKAARGKGLPPAIARVGPKVARVATQTYDALRAPAIP